MYLFISMQNVWITTLLLQHHYYGTINSKKYGTLAFQKVSRSMMFHSRLNSWYQYQMLINESHSLFQSCQ